MHQLAFASLFGFLSIGATDPAPDVVAVCPSEFTEALQPWIQRRTSEGLQVRVVPSGPSAQAVSDNIRHAAVVNETRYILLVGDCQLERWDGRSDPRREVPTYYVRAEATAPWGTTASLPGDLPYGDLDGDELPDAAIGRLPVDTAAQLSSVVQRIFLYEDSHDFGPWRETVQLTAGVGGFGFFADAAIESVTRGILTSFLPATTRTLVTYASAGSPFNPGTDRFHETVVQRYCEGARFWVYAGHGWVTELDRVPQTKEGRPVLSCEDVPKLQCDPSQAPIAVLFACYTGAFDAKEDCLAENMFLSPCGPIAVLSGSRVTMPYGNAAAATGLIRSVYESRAERLGDAWLETLKEMATESDANEELAAHRRMIDTLAKLISPADTELQTEREEHMHLYNWFGDPTLRLRHADKIPLQVASAVQHGEMIEVNGSAPVAGELSISLRRAIGSVPKGTAPSNRYQAANQPDVDSVKLIIERPGPFRTMLPAAGTGVMHVVAHLEAQRSYAAGAARVIVHPAPR